MYRFVRNRTESAKTREMFYLTNDIFIARYFCLTVWWKLGNRFIFVSSVGNELSEKKKKHQKKVMNNGKISNNSQFRNKIRLIGGLASTMQMIWLYGFKFHCVRNRMKKEQNETKISVKSRPQETFILWKKKKKWRENVYLKNIFRNLKQLSGLIMLSSKCHRLI